MIDGAEHFHYLGLARRNRSVMMVFQEGVLILNLDLPGWGVMRPADLEPPHSPEHSASDSDFAANDAFLEDSRSQSTLSTSSSRASSSGSNTPSPGASPRPSRFASPSASSDDEVVMPGWSPTASVLGWHPCEAMVHVGPVTQQAAQTYKSMPSTPHDLQAFVAQLKDGKWAPSPVGSPGTATMVALQIHGELLVMLWEGLWNAAGNGQHQQNGLSAAHACHIVARSVVAPICSLAALPDAEFNEYRGHIVAGPASVLIFDRGLLVQTHTDARLVGWHGFGEHGRCASVSPKDADMIEALCRLKTPPDHGFLRMFFFGDLDVPLGHGPFVAVVFSHKLNRFLCLRLESPSPLLEPGDPQGPTLAAVQQALRQMTPALVHNFHDVQGPYGLGCGSWQVPLFLGAIQCIDACVHVSGLLGTTWYNTLQPVIERQLLAHGKQEGAWLTSGAISQPINRLIDLMRRDTSMRRCEVKVMWPVDLLADLFKALAPEHPARVILAPKAADVEQALRQRGCTLFVFQVPGQVDHTVVLAQGNRCWSGLEHFDLSELNARVGKALTNGPGEHLVALAFVV